MKLKSLAEAKIRLPDSLEEVSLHSLCYGKRISKERRERGDGVRGAIDALYCGGRFTDLGIRRCCTRAERSWIDHEC